MTSVNLDKQLEYMYSLERFGIKLGLEVMEALLAELGNPHTKFPSVHITGTNGKGSCAAMLESVLRTAGYTTALYTSPHLFLFNERIRVGGELIPDENLGMLIEEVRSAAERANLTPTFFEFTTAVAFCYFAEKKPDIAVIEVGMGGLLDATNVITPRVSVITTVGLDHTFLLGKTVAEIAANKAGIIKSDVPVVTGVDDPQIIEYLASIAAEKGSMFTGASPTARDEVKQRYTVPLRGQHQLSNAGVVLLVLEELKRQGMSISEAAIQNGLAATVWPGRLEVVSEQPFILVDGAHNPQSLEALYQFLIEEIALPQYDVLVIGMKNDKDISFVRDTLAPLFSHVIVTEGSYEPMPAEELAQALHHPSFEIVPDPRTAAQRGYELVGTKGSLVVTGSLYMIPPALEYLREQTLATRASPTSLRGFAGQAKPLSS